MKHQPRWRLALLSISVAFGLAACESYEMEPTDTVTTTGNGTPTTVGTTNAVVTTNTVGTTTNIIQSTNVETNTTPEPTDSSEGSSAGGGGVIYTMPAAPVAPVRIVNAAQYRNSDGTYSFYNRVFADCDSFASYLMSSAGVPYIVTNCGTTAFP